MTKKPPPNHSRAVQHSGNASETAVSRSWQSTKTAIEALRPKFYPHCDSDRQPKRSQARSPSLPPNPFQRVSYINHEFIHGHILAIAALRFAAGGDNSWIVRGRTPPRRRLDQVERTAGRSSKEDGESNWGVVFPRLGIRVDDFRALHYPSCQLAT